jgi:hypothetical protein
MLEVTCALARRTLLFPRDGKRAKFFGTNFMVNTIFPPNQDAPQQAGEYSGIVPPDAADQLATRLSRMVANFQDWDAPMPKVYGNWPDDYFAEMPPGWKGNNFFALGGNPIASAQFPVASRIFLASQNSHAAQQVTLQANRTDLLQSDPTLVTGQYFGSKGYADWQALVHSLRTSYGDLPSSYTAYAGNAPAVITSDGGELTFDQTNPNSPVYKVSSPSLQAITGFLAGVSVDLPNLSVAISPSTAPFGSVTLQPVDGQAHIPCA